MKRTIYGLVMPLMAVFLFLVTPSAALAETFPCTADSQCTEDAFPTLDKTCVKAYVCESGHCTFVPDVNGCVNWQADLDCDDGKPCTTDKFVWGKCRHVAWPMSGKPCDDGNACTLESKCSSGVCGGGTTLPCDDGNTCTDDFCDSDTGCDSTAMACTDDGNDCTAEACNPATGLCATTNVAFGTACGAAGAGTVCNGVGACVTPECLVAADCGASVSSCSGGIRSLNKWECAAGTCVLGTEPEFSFPCEFGCDGDVCGAVDNDCDDGDPCTDDSIEVIEPGVHGNCVHEDDGVCCVLDADCSDGNACTEDTCVDGECLKLTAPLDGDACGTAGTCDDGVCEEPPPAPGLALSGTLEVSSGNLIQGTLGLKKPGSDPAVPSGLWKDHGVSVSFSDPECFLGNVKKADEKYALSGTSDDPLVVDPDGDFCGGITVDETVFLAGKSPTALGCVVECVDQGEGKPSTLNWSCGSCAVP